MKHLTIILAAAFSVMCVIASPVLAQEKVLTQDGLRQLLTNNTGRHWSLDKERWHIFTWQSDGILTVTLPNAAPDEKPFDKGTWRVKEIKAEKGDDPADVKRRNEELSYLYCQTLEKATSGHELCFELVQETFEKDGDSDKMAATQEYKYYREAGAETGAFTITRK